MPLPVLIACAFVFLLVLSPVIVNAFAPEANPYTTKDLFTDLHYWEEKTGLNKQEILTLQSSYKEWSIMVERDEDLSPEEQINVDTLFDTWQPLAHKGNLDIPELEELKSVSFNTKVDE